MVVAETQQVPVLQACGASCRPAAGIIDVDTVGADVLEEVVALAEADTRVVGGDIAEGVGQYPVVVGRAADGGAVVPRTMLPRSPSERR